MTDEDPEGDENTTTSTKTRHDYTGTVVALLLIVTACIAMLTYVYRGTSVPLWASSTFGLSTITAVAWSFGGSAIRAAKDALGGST